MLKKVIPGDNLIKLFSLKLTLWQNKLKCKIFQATLRFTSKADLTMPTPSYFHVLLDYRVKNTPAYFSDESKEFDKIGTRFSGS
jgi:hypothetical protein